MTELTGYSIEEINHSGWHQILSNDPKIQEKAVKRMKQIQPGVNHQDDEFEITRADGQKRYLNISSSTISDTGNTIHLMALIRDTTDQKRAEIALLASEAELRAIFENSAAGITISDLNGKILRTNSAHQQMFGYDAVEMDTMSFSDFTHPDDVGKNQGSYDRLLAGKIDHFNMRKRFVHKHGRVVWANVTVSLVNDKNNNPLFVIGIVEDITERKLAEDGKERLIAELQNAFDEIKVLRGIIPICSHCRQIRDDEGFWNNVENYIEQHTDAKFSHGVCPDCQRKYYPDIYNRKNNENK